MDELYNKGEFAQSVTIHHFEKWIDNSFIHEMSRLIEKEINAASIQHERIPSFLDRLELFTIEILKEASSHIFDISLQQHSTTNFSLSQNTLRNCLIYTLSREIPIILRIWEGNISNWEKRQFYVVNVPNLVAALQVLHEHESKIPCILHTTNMKEKFKETFIDNISKLRDETQE